MATRELLVVILNHTNEELNLRPGSPSLDHGEWMDTADSRPPQEILAGESGMLRCKSSRMGAGVKGSATYEVVGYGANNGVTFTWNVQYIGPNKFNWSCTADDFTVNVLGGSGNQAVVVFVFAPARPSETSNPTDSDVFAAVTKYPLDCAKAPVGGFPRS